MGNFSDYHKTDWTTKNILSNFPWVYLSHFHDRRPYTKESDLKMKKSWFLRWKDFFYNLKKKWSRNHWWLLWMLFISKINEINRERAAHIMLNEMQFVHDCCGTFPGADCMNDHLPVIFKFKLKLWKWKKHEATVNSRHQDDSVFKTDIYLVSPYISEMWYYVKYLL